MEHSCLVCGEKSESVLEYYLYKSDEKLNVRRSLCHECAVVFQKELPYMKLCEPEKPDDLDNWI